MENQPLIQLESEGKAPVLRYNIPEPTSYSGRNFIELDLLRAEETPEQFFQPKAFETPEPRGTPFSPHDTTAATTAVVAAMKSGFADSAVFPNVRLTAGTLTLKENADREFQVKSSLPISEELASIDPEEVALAAQRGKILNVYTTQFGTLTYNLVDQPEKAEPALYLVEVYRLSSFLGDYGAGRILKTFSLLPGEKTTVSVKTFQRTEKQSKSASSVLDSFTEESSKAFEESVQEEQSDKREYSKNFQYHAEAEAKASWGFGSAKVSGGVKGGTNSAREEFAKNMTNATQKHAMTASAKREVQINTSFEVTEQTQEETSIVREIENVNLSRTLNFAFRQMNQEFVTALHLVDVRVAFFNGFSESRREVPLPRLDSLLEDYVQGDANQKRAREAVMDSLANILDFELQLHDDLIRETEVGGETYVSINTDKTQTLTEGGREFEVPGVILSRTSNVMRTEGVMVEALLGAGEALDSYAVQLQQLEVERQSAAVQQDAERAKREALLNQIVEDADEARAALLEKLTCPCGAKGDASDENG